MGRRGAIDRFGALGAGSWIALAALGLGATLGGYVVGGALVIGGVAVAQRGPARKAGMPPSACIDGAERQRC
ncbi:MAG: hypothetical protein M3Q31_15300 [Actinomycetota bacterium]|nr:hypothetical protein [Actinomycetota bacterium]